MQEPTAKGYTGILACVHRTADQMREELYTVVDQGCTVVDVAAPEEEHYKQMMCDLFLLNETGEEFGDESKIDDWD